MLRTPIVHPDLLAALARAGHGSLVLVADANYPSGTRRGPNAATVHLNLRPGTVDAVTVLDAVLATVPVEAVHVMAPGADARDAEPAIYAAFRASLAAAGVDLPLDPVERFAFYDLAASPDLAVLVVSGEERLFGNVLLRVGVVAPS